MRQLMYLMVCLTPSTTPGEPGSRDPGYSTRVPAADAAGGATLSPGKTAAGGSTAGKM